MFVHICMLSQVYEILITQLYIFSINFVNVLSYYSCVRYLVFLALFLSISMVFIDYTCITSVTNIVNLLGCYLNDLKFFVMVAYIIFGQQNSSLGSQNNIQPVA